jgi:hypothetical protein
MRSRDQYLETLMPRYLKADRKSKTSLLDEYCLNTGQNRKYAIRKIRQMAFREPKPCGGCGKYSMVPVANVFILFWKQRWNA